RLADADEAVERVEEERAPDEEDLGAEEHRGRERPDRGDDALEPLRPAEHEGVLEEDVGEEIRADREHAGERVQPAEHELAALARQSILPGTHRGIGLPFPKGCIMSRNSGRSGEAEMKTPRARDHAFLSPAASTRPIASTSSFTWLAEV